MKDLYSFHSTQIDFQRYYNLVKTSYLKTLKRCDLEAIVTEASGAGFTKGFTHEFQVLAVGGEDTIIFCPKKHFAQNKEITKFKKGNRCPICKKNLEEGKSIEVGNIFPLGTKYSKDLGAYFIDRDGKKRLIIMGCYGLGTSRIMAAIVETHYNSKGILWPNPVSPFQIHVIPIEKTKKVQKVTEKLYFNLQKNNFEVLYDDRENKSPGEKFADCDLIGIPYRLVVSERTLAKNYVEIKKRSEKKIKLIKLNFLNSYIRKLC